MFRWTALGLAIESKVNEFVLNQRLGWYGYVPGAKPSFYHSWYLQPQGAMCHVVMDDAGIGKDAAGLRKSDETLMHPEHDLWLATLKRSRLSGIASAESTRLFSPTEPQRLLILSLSKSIAEASRDVGAPTMFAMPTRAATTGSGYASMRHPQHSALTISRGQMASALHAVLDLKHIFNV